MLVILSGVCKQWRNIALDPKFWVHCDIDAVAYYYAVVFRMFLFISSMLSPLISIPSLPSPHPIPKLTMLTSSL
jgi:hypothetical protein